MKGRELWEGLTSGILELERVRWVLEDMGEKLE